MLIPAFDLASLAGLARGKLRWSVLLRLPTSAGLVFESMDGLFEAPSSDIRPVAMNDVPHQSLVTRLVRRHDRLLPVLDLDSIGDSIRRRTGPGQPGNSSGVLAGDPGRG
jgi:chemotaxis signal transduction protein